MAHVLNSSHDKKAVAPRRREAPRMISRPGDLILSRRCSGKVHRYDRTARSSGRLETEANGLPRGL